MAAQVVLALCVGAIAPSVALAGKASAVGASAPTTTPNSAAPNSATGLEPSGAVPGEVIITYRDDATSQARSRADKRGRVGSTARLSGRDARIVLATLEAGADVSAAITELEGDPAVLSAQPNYTYQSAATPNDYYFASNQWGLNNTGQTGGSADADIDAPEAWSKTTGSSNVVVAVIDSGVLMSHQDLDGNIWTNPGEIAGNGVDDDHNGYVDDVHGWDFVNGDANPNDDRGHGTNAASIIGAEGNNGVGVAGVAWDVSIMPLKVLDAFGGGNTAGAVAAIHYAAAEGVRIVNNSWGVATANDPALKAAIEETDALFVCAAGNGGYIPADGSDPSGNIGDNSDIYPFIPASLNSANIISVGASTNTDGRATFSNYGAQSVDLFAPGVSILGAGIASNSKYVGYTGTSMAAPHVSGAAALMLSANPNLTVGQLKAGLLASADRKAAFAPLSVSGGRLNLAGAVTVASRGTGALSGTITHNGAPISGARIEVGGVGTVCVTDASGLYRADDIPSGTYSITVSAPGLKTETLAGVAITSGSTVVRNVTLRAISTITVDAPAFTYSASTRLSGTLSYLDSSVSTSAVPIGNAPVTLERSVNGGSTWSRFTTVTTSAEGSWSYTYNPASTFERNQLIRATYPGVDASAPSGAAGSSAVASLGARTYLSTPTTSVASPLHKTAFSVRGYIGPKYTAGTLPAKVLVYRLNADGTWTLVQSANMKAYAYSSTRSALRGSLSIASKGTYQIRFKSTSAVRTALGYPLTTTYGGSKTFRVR